MLTEAARQPDYGYNRIAIPLGYLRTTHSRDPEEVRHNGLVFWMANWWAAGNTFLLNACVQPDASANAAPRSQ